MILLLIVTYIYSPVDVTRYFVISYVKGIERSVRGREVHRRSGGRESRDVTQLTDISSWLISEARYERKVLCTQTKYCQQVAGGRLRLNTSMNTAAVVWIRRRNGDLAQKNTKCFSLRDSRASCNMQLLVRCGKQQSWEDIGVHCC